MIKFNKLARVVTKVSLSTVLLTSLNVVAGTASSDFIAKIAVEGSCDISVPATVIFNGGDAILPEAIVSGDAVTMNKFNLTFSNCKGAGVTPKIGVTGETVVLDGTPYFADSSSTSVGYGFHLFLGGSAPAFGGSDNLAEDKVIPSTSKWDPNTNLNTLNGSSLEIHSWLTCGACTTPGRVGGDLKATVTFDFQYD